MQCDPCISVGIQKTTSSKGRLAALGCSQEPQLLGNTPSLRKESEMEPKKGYSPPDWHVTPHRRPVLMTLVISPYTALCGSHVCLGEGIGQADRPEDRANQLRPGEYPEKESIILIVIIIAIIIITVTYSKPNGM